MVDKCLWAEGIKWVSKIRDPNTIDAFGYLFKWNGVRSSIIAPFYVCGSSQTQELLIA